jgi:hypothetical protein
MSADDLALNVPLMIPEELRFHFALTPEQLARARPVMPHSLAIIDPYNVPRAYIQPNGLILDMQRYPLGGFREQGNTVQVLSFNLQPIGSIDAGGIIADADGHHCGFLEVLYAGIIKNAAGSIIAEIDTSGEIKGNANTLCGRIENFTLHQANHLAAFCLFFDEDNLLEGGKA